MYRKRKVESEEDSGIMPVTKITSKDRPLSVPMKYFPTKGQGYFYTKKADTGMGRPVMECYTEL